MATTESDGDGDGHDHDEAKPRTPQPSAAQVDLPEGQASDRAGAIGGDRSGVAEASASEATSESSPAPASATKQRYRALWVALGGVALVLLINAALLTVPVWSRLGKDKRNEGIVLTAHYQWCINGNRVVLTLWSVGENASPVDVFRATSQAAGAIAQKGLSFDAVNLDRGFTTVFVMKGDALRTLGSEFDAGQNPIYLIRTFPEQLYKPSGQEAFGHWTGGWLGVATKQMEDFDSAMRQWVEK